MTSRSGLIAAILVSVLLLGGANNSCSSSNTGSIGPSQGQVVGAIVGVAAGITVGTIVVVEVHKSHHTLKGCVSTGPEGLVLRDDSNSGEYILSGVTADLKVGDQVRVHGNKQKKQKGAERTFVVEKLNKDYGACKAAPTPAQATAAALRVSAHADRAQLQTPADPADASR